MTLVRIATEFRRGVLSGRKSNGMCYAVCAPLQTMLNLYGHETELRQGWITKRSGGPGYYGHFWLKLCDGRILDPTADQFTSPKGEKMPKIYLGPKPR